MKRRIALLSVAITILTIAAPAQANSAGIVSGLARNAHSLTTTQPSDDLRDLRPLGRMVGDATVVGAGEATHNSSEFFTMKHRIFQYLVEEKGFSTFALEADWDTGLRLNDYVVHGRGDLRQIMREEFEGSNTYRFWSTQEYLDLLAWMRAYNVRHPDREPLQFMGDDIGYPGAPLFDRVTDYVKRYRPALLPQLTALYGGLRPTMPLDEWMGSQFSQPLATRQALAARAQQAVQLLERQRGDDRLAWATQHARVIAQVFALYAFDVENPVQYGEAMRHRDRAMADNTVWWHRQTGAKIVLSAHNAHIAYTTYEPERYPKMQGAFLRDRLGADYVNLGFTFNAGSFNAQDEENVWRTFTLGPAPRGSNEYTLNAASRRDYLLDLRTVRGAARAWLHQKHSTRMVGTGYPDPPVDLALAEHYDLLVHLHTVKAARQLS